MKNRVLNALDDVDPTYIDEHLGWSRRKKSTRTMMYKTVSVAACLVLVITSIFALMPGGFLRGDDHGIVPHESLTTDTQFGDHTDPQIDPPTVIYAENFELSVGGNGIESVPPEIGSVKFSGSLYELMNNNEIYENCVFAVSVSFSMDFDGSDDYHALIAEAEELYDSMWERYYNEFQSHKLNTHYSEVMDWNCEECLHYNSLHEQDESEIDRLYRESEKVYEADAAIHAENLRKYCNSYIESMGLEYSYVTVIWTNETVNVDLVTTQEVRMLHMTKEQLKTFNAPNDVGVEFVLLPEWIDSGESIIYRDYALYPVELD